MKTACIIAAMLAATAAGGCSSGRGNTDRLVEATLARAGDNAVELQALLDRYDDGRRDVARYVVAAAWERGARTGAGMDSVEALYRGLAAAGTSVFDPAQSKAAMRYAAMPLRHTSDAAVLTADYLAENIDDAWQLWKGREWNRGLPQELMEEMLLPYRTGDEPLTLWRAPYREWLAGLEDTLAGCGSSVGAARIVAQAIGPCPYNDKLSTPHRSALALLEAPLGYCREDCDRTLYAMRSLGIPVAVDRMLVSPENGASHQWTVVWDNIDGSTRLFDNSAYLPTRDSIHYDQRRKGKVYRSSFAPDLERLERYRNAANPPAMLLNPWLRDVTAEYFGHNRAEVEITPPEDVSKGNAVYLGVFDGRRFRPVDIAEVRGDRAVFTDIEPNLIYAPVTADASVCGYPFMLLGNGRVHSFVPQENKRERVRLTRKFPVRFHLKNRLESVAGVRVQSAPTPCGPWTDIDSVVSAPAHNYLRIARGGRLTGRWLRMLKPQGGPALIDMLVACRDTLGLDPQPMSVTGPDRDRYLPALSFGHSFGLYAGETGCVMHIDTPEEPEALFLIPANDDNFVVPAQEYELLYMSGSEGWKSLGRKMSTGFCVDFEAPEGAVLWLRNLTKGREEQIFICRGGRQLFNIDLYDPAV